MTAAIGMWLAANGKGVQRAPLTLAQPPTQVSINPIAVMGRSMLADTSGDAVCLVPLRYAADGLAFGTVDGGFIGFKHA